MHGVPTSAVKIASAAASRSTVAATYCGCSGESLARSPGQLVQPGPGPPVVRRHPVQVRRIGLGLQQRQQRVNRVLDRADQRHPHLHPLADLLAPHVDLDHRDALGEERPVGEVGAEHDQRVAVLHGPVPGAEPDQPGHPHVVRVVVLHELLAAERVHHWGLQRPGQRDQLVMRPGAARPGQDRHRAGVVQHLRGGRQRLLVRADDRRGGPDRIGSGPAGASARNTSPGTTTTATPPRASAARMAISSTRGSCSGTLTSSQYTLHSPNSSVRMGFLEVAAADLLARDMRRDGQHRHPAAVRVEQPVDQVQVARPAAARAHRQLPGQRRLRRRREPRGLLMPDVLPGELAVAAQRVGKPVQRIPRQPVNPAHAGCLQRCDHDLSYRGSHRLVLPFVPARGGWRRICHDEPLRAGAERLVRAMSQALA